MKRKLAACLLLIFAGGLGGAWWLNRPVPVPEPYATPLTELLDADEAGFATAESAWRFAFPEDHGTHPAYRSESWYFTGHLATNEGRRFGFHLSFFRFALKPLSTPQRASAWATREVYRGQFALTDVAQEAFHAFERFSRAALGLSGASSPPVRIWVEDWCAEVNESTPMDFHLHAAQGEIEMDLVLQSAKPIVLPRQASPSPDSSGFSSPFHAYLIPRLIARGTIQVGKESFPVEGLAWLDRAWGRVPIPQGQVVWDRFLLQLEDGREILCFRLRRRDGSGEPIPSAILIARDGSLQQFGREDVTIEVLEHWSSPLDGVRYPTRWRLHLSGPNLALEIIPEIAGQEMNHSLRYWGGSVRVSGQADGQAVRGAGYVELTGYAPAKG